MYLFIGQCRATLSSSPIPRLGLSLLCFFLSFNVALSDDASHDGGVSRALPLAGGGAERRNLFPRAPLLPPPPPRALQAAPGNDGLPPTQRPPSAGRLLGVFGGAVQPLLRAEGDATDMTWGGVRPQRESCGRSHTRRFEDDPRATGASRAFARPSSRVPSALSLSASHLSGTHSARTVRPTGTCRAPATDGCGGVCVCTKRRWHDHRPASKAGQGDGPRTFREEQEGGLSPSCSPSPA